jgi:hypothetical protein
MNLHGNKICPQGTTEKFATTTTVQVDSDCVEGEEIVIKSCEEEVEVEAPTCN